METSTKAFFSAEPLQDIENDVIALIDLNRELKKRLTEQKNESEKIILSLLREYLELTEKISQLAVNYQLENKEAKQMALDIGELEERLSRFLKRMKVKPLKTTTGKIADTAKHRVKKAAREKGSKEGTILEVLRQGYVWKGLILRRAEVKAVRNNRKK